LAETESHLSASDIEATAVEARWIIEEASGFVGPDLIMGLDELATVRSVAHLDSMVGRRLAGEPIQYVLGHWSFRSLDLLCDRRVLIPRPATEQVVGVALERLGEITRSRPEGWVPTVVDLGTGSGAIALSLAVEHRRAEVWAVDLSADAVAVARANLAGLGMAGARVRVVEGSWFDALPGSLEGAIDLAITNPPYIGASEELPASVVDWEPAGALVSGPSGLEAYRELMPQARRWLAPDGVLVAEIGSSQGDAVTELARSCGFVDVEILTDHAGLDRTLSARQP